MENIGYWAKYEELYGGKVVANPATSIRNVFLRRAVRAPHSLRINSTKLW
jgi:hypothetical protein